METLRLDRFCSSISKLFFTSVCGIASQMVQPVFFLLEFNYRAKGGPSLKEEEG